MRKVFKLFLPLVFSIVGIFYFILPILFIESYYPFYPHIDTQFAKGFTIDCFEKVNNGMSKTEVENLLGQPLNFSQKTISSLQPKNSYISVYAFDGKSNWSDNAWESFDIYFNSNNVVIGKSRKWWYD